MNWKIITVGGVAVFSAIFVCLFIKNKRAQQAYRELSKESLIVISKKIRKQRYTVYKQMALFAMNIMQQMRNNINTALIEQYINGPESPLKVKQLFEEINHKICQQHDITAEEYASSLEQYKTDFDIQALIKLQQNDYADSLKGKLPHFQVVVPASLTKQLFVEIQNRITKLAYCQQVKIFRKLKQYTEIQLQQDPSLLQDLGNPQAQQQSILQEYGLQTEFEPASAIFKEAEARFHSDLNFKAKIEQIERTYQKLLKKYAPKLQTKTITDHQLNDLEEQILRTEIKA